MDLNIASLLGIWAGVEQKAVYTSSGDEGCYLVTREFALKVEFLPNNTLRATLKQEDSDDGGTWRVADSGI